MIWLKTTLLGKYCFFCQQIDTNRNLEWLKDVKKAHGSVEVTSLVQADAINANGIYTVGRRAYKDKVTDQTNVSDAFLFPWCKLNE